MSGTDVLKIRCRVCCNLFSYGNSSWTCASAHILSHNLLTPEGIVTATATVLDSECDANSKTFPLHNVHAMTAVKKEVPFDVAVMGRTSVVPSCGVNTAAYHGYGGPSLSE